MHDKDFAISKEKQNNDNQVFVAGLKLIGRSEERRVG